MKDKNLLIRGRVKDNKILFEQYKMFCDSAENITNKRQNMNNFYLAVNSFALAVAGYMSSNTHNNVSCIISGIGIIVCIVWWRNINSYRRLNNAKFKVIHELEKYMPAKIYSKEDEYLRTGYYNLTSSEKIIPIVFGILYVIVLIFSLL